ncbi:MAG: hypothetical protein AABX02_01930 [archaeon]
MVSNPFKLVMAVLLFFLALTYVRALEVQTPLDDIVLQGDVPVAYAITFTNAGAGSIKPLIEVDGPLILESSGADENQTIPAHSTKKLVVFISASPVLKVGEAYVAQIRVTTPDQTMTIPLNVKKEAAPLFAPAPSPNPNTPSPAVGLVGLLSANAGIILNVILIIIIVALLIALFSRVKNRVGK